MTDLQSILIQTGLTEPDANTISTMLHHHYGTNEQIIQQQFINKTLEQFRIEMKDKIVGGRMKIDATFSALKTWILKRTNSSLSSSSLTSDDTTILVSSSSSSRSTTTSENEDNIPIITTYKKAWNLPFSQTIHNKSKWQSFTNCKQKNENIMAISLSHDGNHLFISTEGSSCRERIGVFSVLDGQFVCWMIGLQDSVIRLCCCPLGQKLASGGIGGELAIWNATTFTVEQILQPHTSDVWAVCFDPKSGTILASGDENGTIRLNHFNVNTNQWSILHEFLNIHQDQIDSLTFYYNNSTSHHHHQDNEDNDDHGNKIDNLYVLSASWDESLQSIHVQTGKITSSFEGHQDWVTACAWCEIHSLAISGSTDGSIFLWKTTTCKLYKELECAHEEQITSLAVHQSLLASGDLDGIVYIWSLPELYKINNLKLSTSDYFFPSKAIVMLAFDITGSWLICGEEHGVICIWEEDQC
jgi:WD40 repeat protein